MSPFERSFLPQGTRGDILAAALTHLAAKGLYEFTLAEISRAARISRPKLAYHFTEKNDLLLELTSAWGQSGQMVTLDLLQSHMGSEPVQLILKISEATFLWKEKCPHFARFTPVLNQLAMHLPRFEKAQRIVTDTGLERIHQLVTQAGLEKRKSKALAEQLHWIMIGGFLYHLATPSSSGPAVLKVTQKSLKTVLEMNLQ